MEKTEFVEDSGGPGKCRGGLGSTIELKLLAPTNYFNFIEKSKTPHWGLKGGQAGLRNYAVIQSKKQGEFEILKTSGIQLDEGDRIVAVAGGGGGYGDPLERDPGNVREDVENGYVSIEHARQDYGVVIDPDTHNIDVEATAKLRSELRKKPAQEF